jgi:hypothetical protein
MDLVVTRRILVLATAGLCAAACSSSASSPATGPTSPAASSAPAASNAPGSAGAGPAGTESPPPGDIPDSTVYVAYQPVSGQYQVKVPEGWARTISAAGVSFTDKLNTITIQTVQAAALTLASALATEVPRIKGSVRGFVLTGVSNVTWTAGTAVLIRYSADNPPDPVTGRYTGTRSNAMSSIATAPNRC